ncbi:hypothetical protein HCU01_31250 [Halomonas cupida]|uniref:Rhodanese-like domain-containing protein n=1 Tax=Halomonas cupida TaxID=44933 RepID=A0ABQ0WHH7_9GAMM|nr:hypothetical protein HCU01_31250 [Halomonas cupida]
MVSRWRPALVAFWLAGAWLAEQPPQRYGDAGGLAAVTIAGDLKARTVEGVLQRPQLAGFQFVLDIRKSMLYDEGKEMARHAGVTLKTGAAIYFCDLHCR